MRASTTFLIGLSNFFPRSDMLARAAVRAHKRDMQLTLAYALRAARRVGTDRGTEMVGIALDHSLEILERMHKRGSKKANIILKTGLLRNTIDHLPGIAPLSIDLVSAFGHRLEKLVSSRSPAVARRIRHAVFKAKADTSLRLRDHEQFATLYASTLSNLGSGIPQDEARELRSTLAGSLEQHTKNYLAVHGHKKAEAVLQSVCAASDRVLRERGGEGRDHGRELLSFIKTCCTPALTLVRQASKAEKSLEEVVHGHYKLILAKRRGGIALKQLTRIAASANTTPPSNGMGIGQTLFNLNSSDLPDRVRESSQKFLELLALGSSKYPSSQAPAPAGDPHTKVVGHRLVRPQAGRREGPSRKVLGAAAIAARHG